jgi:hypothetical protein
MIRASNWRPLVRNTLQGFVDLELAPTGLALRECTFHRHEDGREWIGLPGKPQIDRDGTPRKDPITGKLLYTPLVVIKDKAARERFRDAAIAAVHRLIDGGAT